MAKRNYTGRKRNFSGNRRRKTRKKFTEAEKLAFRMGQVKAGLKNPDSLVSEAYNKGVSSTEKKPRKSLF